MRVEGPASTVSLPDIGSGQKAGGSAPAHEKDVKADPGAQNSEISVGNVNFPPNLGVSELTYSPASLKAAADYYAKFLTVAQSNIEAAKHASGIPQQLLDRFNGAAS
jgi:hypothetical protein